MNSRRCLRKCVTVMMSAWLSGCVGLSTDQLTNSPTGSPEPTARPSVVAPTEAVSVSPTSSASTVEVASTETLAPATPSLAATPTIPLEAKLTVKCLDVAPDLSGGQSYSNVIVLRDLATEHLLALKAARPPSTIGAQSSDRLFDPTVSPGGRFLAYRRVRYDEQGNILAKEVEVADATGLARASLPWQRGWSGFHWLDEERLVILVSNSDLLNRDSSLSYLMVFPFTGQQEPITVTPPDVYDIDPLPYWSGRGLQVYNPTLTQVAYLQLVDGIYWAYALWDIREAKTLASLVAFDNERTPVWSPTGERFVIAANPLETRAYTKFELYLFDQTGAISKLTNLTAYYPATYIQSYSWSPDERYIAFWLNTDIPRDQDYHFGQQNLAVLDTDTLQVTNYCLPGDFSTSWATLVSAPIWSPDSQQLLIENRYAEQASRVILVDLIQAFATQLADNAEPVGWMVASP